MTRAPRTNRTAPVSPRARRALRQHNLDAPAVIGSGPRGRILHADVVKAAAARPGTAPAVHSAELAPMRRAIARITAASAAIPQFQLHAELDASRLVDLRGQLLARIQSDHKVRLSVTDLLLGAMALGLRDFPAANAIWQNDSIRTLQETNLGLAVSLDDGMLIPVLRNTDQLSIEQLALERRRAVDAARQGRLAADATHGAATSLSNLGMTRVDSFSAIVFPPQSTILTAGRIVERPIVVDGQLCARPSLRLTLSVDHRVLDGAGAAQFLGRIVHFLEQPALLIYGTSGCGGGTMGR